MALRHESCIIYLMKDDTVGRVAEIEGSALKNTTKDTLGSVGMKAQKTVFFQEIAKKRHFLKKKTRKSLHCLV